MNEYKISVPRIKLPKKFVKSPAKYLRKIVIDNAEERGLLTPENREEYLQRIDHEVAVFEQCGYVEYLLGVVNMTEQMSLLGISYFAGRGVFSASLVFYCLRITNIDPIKHDLMFERFLNPERVSMPDFDTDFCYDRRGEVIDYVAEKYGAEHVCGIATFGTLSVP